MLKLFSFFILLILFTGCAPKQPTKENIDDFFTISQDPRKYLNKTGKLQLLKQNTLNKYFNIQYFRPWQIDTLSASKTSAMWGFGYANRVTFGQNYKKHTSSWYNKLKDNANFEKYNTYLAKAIVVKNTNMRVLPTNQPIFLDPNKAGEGFPFDYNQNTSVYINTPILISHLSYDRAWAYIATNFAMGWVKTSDIATLDLAKRRFFQNSYYAVAFKDNFPIYDEQNNFIESIKLGTIFPIYKGKVLVATKDKGLKGRLLYTTSKHMYKKPIRFNKANINKAIKELLNEPYGWGGLYNTRDCSSLTRDFFSLFGLYLARNSAGQKSTGNYISLKELSNQEKKQKILELGKPFLTIIYLKGHVMLYVGEDKGEPIVFHQMWGVRTLKGDGKQGRFVIGKTAFTTIEPGKELSNFDKQSSVLSKIEGIIQLTPSH